MTDLKDCILVMLDCIRYDGLMQRHQHLAREMSRYLPVVYVEETPSRLRYLLDMNPFDPALTGYKLGIREIGENLGFFKAPPCLPRSLGYERMIEGSAKRVANALKPLLPKDKSVIIWNFSPTGYGSIGLYNEVMSVFDCFDAYGEFPGQEKLREQIRAAAAETARRVDLIIATNVELRDRLTESNSNAVVVQNGCDPGHFISGGRKPSGEMRTIDMEALPGPIIGYMGDIAPWLELDYMLQVAERHPDWSIVLLGTWKMKEQIPKNLPNVYIPGRVPYDELPYYARMFDVGTIPFVLNDLTRVVNPLKLYEYFAMGKPVVATPLPEVVYYEDIVYLAGSADEFVALTELAVREADDSPARAKRVDVAKGNSWDARGKTIKELLEKNLRNRIMNRDSVDK